MSTIVTVFGLPAPQGSKRHVGHGVMVESSKQVAPWREAVKAAVIWQHGIRPPMTGPLFARIVFTLPKPKSAAKDAKPCRRPDIDKLVRSTFDALTDCGVWEDDGQVVELTVVKSYPNVARGSMPTPGATIWVGAA